MRKVLLIEDDPTMLSLIHMLLELEGFQVVRLNGELEIPSMLETLRKESPDVLLLDVHLRRASGIDLVRAVRRDSALKSTIVLMFSGMEMSAQCREAGADDFMLKPFMPDELVNKLHNLSRET
jgi:DNA-binding response OmpR family regulator